MARRKATLTALSGGGLQVRRKSATSHCVCDLCEGRRHSVRKESEMLTGERGEAVRFLKAMTTLGATTWVGQSCVGSRGTFSTLATAMELKKPQAGAVKMYGLACHCWSTRGALNGKGLSSSAPLSYHCCLRKHTIQRVEVELHLRQSRPLLSCLPRRSPAFAVFYNHVVHVHHRDTAVAWHRDLWSH